MKNIFLSVYLPIACPSVIFDLAIYAPVLPSDAYVYPPYQYVLISCDMTSFTNPVPEQFERTSCPNC
uniref:Uncharacterized protein n=1 Tax=Caenorhabditis japonica TaxID=281687 RepID=A0A8R1EQ99_CAEJA